MKRNYYIFTPGRLRRRQNTIYFEAMAGDPHGPMEFSEHEDFELWDDFEAETDDKDRIQRKPIPIEDVEAFYCFGEISFNSKFLNFLSQAKIALHLFNYYGYYSGSYYPREYLISGFLTVHQVQHYLDEGKRLALAKEFVSTAVDNLLRNLKYYKSRKEGVDAWADTIEGNIVDMNSINTIAELMGYEGRMREAYYRSFGQILDIELEFTKRVRRPPDNMINALISFGNAMVYTTCLSEIYRTQLNPTISFLHEPGERRFSLSLDLAEVFKPLLADRAIFKLLNTKMLTEKDFDKNLNRCYLEEKGRKVFVKEFDERLKTTIQHRKLNRKVSYRQLIRLKCYKLIKHLTGEQRYKGFRAWW
ncbi:MAG TPA: type I-B CRISPR-associated endonuclease Cas1 [bacterium]|nr:type I-B CRISPR-associated endonuclease Cas1 [bacterium]